MRKLLYVLVFALGATLGGVGCAARGYATVESPGPRVVYVDGYPGWLWVDGQWYWSGSRWVWTDGYWLRDRPGYAWSPGYYHPTTHVWIAGTWGPRGSYYYSSPHRTYYGGSVHGGGAYHSNPRNIRTWRHHR
jgi:hypothetical protein